MTSSESTSQAAMKRVFISHVHLEEDVALILEKWLEASFDGQLKVFVSSSPDLAGLGKWLDDLQYQLSRSRVLLVLASPLALHSHWVFFETGFASALEGTTIIPICSYGQLPEDLPPPLTEWRVLQLLHPQFGSQLVTALRKQLNLTSKKRFDYAGLRRKLKGADRKLENKIRLLRAIAGRDRANSTWPKLKEAVRVGKAPCQQALLSLELGGFVRSSTIGFLRDPGYSLLDRGTKTLERLDLKPLLPKESSSSTSPPAAPTASAPSESVSA